jgi:hypothetical protein
MKRILLAAAASLLLAPVSTSQVQYDRFFTDMTMRVDYYHTGTKGEEYYSLDRVYKEGKWPGSRTNLLDTLNLGEYLVRVYDQASTALIFSRGFSTIFNEWQTTDEATKGMYRTFSESVRMPYPQRAVQVTIARRNALMHYQELASFYIDPADPSQVVKEKRPSPFKVTPLMNSGDPATKVDIVIIGDGYARADMDKFRKDAERFNNAMFATQPFKSRKKDFNVWLIEAESKETGVDVPDRDVWKENILGTRYNTFGSARYILTDDNKALRDVAAAAPYDFVCIIVNDTRYGGGGIYNLYATTYSNEQNEGQKWQMDYVYVHEFGHSFGGLGDEYYSSSVAYSDFYPEGVEPWEPNVTRLLDKKNVKWSAYLTPGIELPTPWAKASYDSIEAIRGKLDRLAPDYYEKREPLYRAGMDLLKNSPYAGKVGAFEGAGSSSKGLYRPSVDCRMFSLSLVDFDPVCSAAINRVIDFYAR